MLAIRLVRLRKNAEMKKFIIIGTSSQPSIILSYADILQTWWITVIVWSLLRIVRAFVEIHVLDLTRQVSRLHFKKSIIKMNEKLSFQ